MSVWLKQSMNTHFACGDILYRKNVNERSFNRVFNGIKQCVDEIVECPICEYDTFSDGVYYNRLTEECFVKLIGVWYKYSNTMFKYYQMSLIISEMDTKDHKAILEICNTKYATKLQREYALHINNFYYYKRMRKESMIKMKSLRHRIKDFKNNKEVN